jgi:hypothetical protein
MVVATGGDEDRLIAVARLLLEAEYVTPEAESAPEVRHLEMNVADVHARIDWPTAHAVSLVKPQIVFDLR